ncbi:MAG: hypothetical protein IH820_01085 [Bacteroidetes bacterium]|nr:hypothetical protein [Bacteroidota bacterium]
MNQQASLAQEAEQNAELWPRHVQTEDAEITIFQPQIDHWPAYLSLDGHGALAITPNGSDTPIYGTVAFHAETDTDFDNRLVLVTNKTLLSLTFPSTGAYSQQALEAMVRALPLEPEVLPLDFLLVSTEGLESEAPSVDVGARPPSIYTSQEPAILVIIDGDPVLYPIENTTLEVVVNTNWDLFLVDEAYYLLNEDRWLTARDLGGPWSPTSQLPEGFSQLPNDENWQGVHEHIPARAVSPGEAPVVYTSTLPAELILIEGSPDLVPIPETELLYVANTESDLFLYTRDRYYYFLISGRWFKARGLDGGWETVGGALPDVFAMIPPEHERGTVRASVPGTPEAAEAVKQAQIPQTAEVDRNTTVEVTYVGEPEFEPIDGTTMHYAVNTSYDIIQVGNQYYLCSNGIWFVAPSATGPFQVTDTIPASIYTIPESSPVYHTTYVYVYESTPTTVTTGYTQGYMGVYIAWGVLVFGTGHYHPPYVYYGPHYAYPIYYPYRHSYGMAAYYNPHTGTYARGAVAYGPYGGVGRAAAYNPRTGTYARGVAAYGPYGAGRAAQAYNPRTGTYRAGYQAATPYEHWGEQVVRRGDEWAHTGHYANRDGAVAGFETSKGAAGVGVRGEEGRGAVVRDQEGNVYAGRDGKVYKRDKEEGWSRRDGDAWNQVETPDDRPRTARADNARSNEAAQQQRAANTDRSAQAQRERNPQASQNAARRPSPSQADRSTSTRQQLDKDARARSEGNRRNRDFQSSRPSRGGAQGSTRKRGRRGRR